ncbi:MAG: Chemotaxis protein methyltransferase CheR [Myxococcaceae bacterium]|nr:Chemotaxis protein methyltransferase CheR [Myxococcaceae bacterium]
MSDRRVLRVLVVEDDEDSALLLAETLGDHGYAVEVAHDGASAIVKADEFKPQVAVLDVGLPDMDGYQLATKLRALTGLPPELRLIALTGYGGDEERRRSREAGFDVHLVKPVLPDALAKAIEN